MNIADEMTPGIGKGWVTMRRWNEKCQKKSGKLNAVWVRGWREWNAVQYDWCHSIELVMCWPHKKHTFSFKLFVRYLFRLPMFLKPTNSVKRNVKKIWAIDTVTVTVKYVCHTGCEAKKNIYLVWAIWAASNIASICLDIIFLMFSHGKCLADISK